MSKMPFPDYSSELGNLQVYGSSNEGRNIIIPITIKKDGVESNYNIYVDYVYIENAQRDLISKALSKVERMQDSLREVKTLVRNLDANVIGLLTEYYED